VLQLDTFDPIKQSVEVLVEVQNIAISDLPAFKEGMPLGYHLVPNKNSHLCRI
jgi:hypothetical protein